MQLGSTFSHPHLNWLELDPIKAIKEYKNLGFKWIRLGCYWNEIEKIEGKFDFSNLDPLVEFCENNKIKTVLTVGMKAPRWPEYHIPEWLIKKLSFKKKKIITPKDKVLLEKTLIFIESCVNHYKKLLSIQVWQVENEPLDPSGPDNWTINKNFLSTETNTVLKFTDQILINLWGNDMLSRLTYKKIPTNTNILGIDIYPKQYAKHIKKYIGPRGTKTLFKLALSRFIETDSLYITELQAEPWEPGELVTNKDNPPSFTPTDFEKNLSYVLEFNPKVIFLWGFEYWLWRKIIHKDNRYWKSAKEVIKKYR
jgi:hypothetical protein